MLCAASAASRRHCFPRQVCARPAHWDACSLTGHACTLNGTLHPTQCCTAEIVSTLLAAGAGDQLEWQSSKGLRPLHCAANIVRPAVVAQLLQLGAEVDAPNRRAGLLDT